MKCRNRLRELKKQMRINTIKRIAYAFFIQHLTKKLDDPKEVYRQFIATFPRFGVHIADLARMLDLEL